MKQIQSNANDIELAVPSSKRYCNSFSNVERRYKSSLTNISPFYRNATGAMKEVPNKEISKGNNSQ